MLYPMFVRHEKEYAYINSSKHTFEKNARAQHAGFDQRNVGLDQLVLSDDCTKRRSRRFGCSETTNISGLDTGNEPAILLTSR
jgi:hypothetical protein